MSRHIIGIDPGKQGAAVSLRGDGSIAVICPGATTPHEQMRELAFAKGYANDAGIHAVIEHCHAFPGIAARANFTVGVGYGFWQGMLVALGIGYETVTAAVWQKIITKRKGWSRAQLKAALVAEAVRRWPEIGKLPKGKQSGVADAALIAEWARTRGS